ncbi:MAG: formyltetrahydrofolate deformylase [Casimicrobiaceae bacterium]
MSRFVLTLSCPDRPGIVHAVSGFLVAEGCNIVEAQQFDDESTGRFFMRVEFVRQAEEPIDAVELSRRFRAVSEPMAMQAAFWDATHRLRTLILVSRQGHCLNDLLFRHRNGQLPIEIAAVASNHRDFYQLVAGYGIPFHHLPVTPETKPEQERKLLALIEEEDIELVVLARYMQILSPALCERLAGRAINIHHSFLPSFKGARPYHQAHERGVKLIGATAHYVTTDLDEGPIIEQEVTRVTHAMGPEALTEAGQDLECRALARAVRWHAEHRVLLNGKRTVVFGV